MAKRYKKLQFLIYQSWCTISNIFHPSSFMILLKAILHCNKVKETTQKLHYALLQAWPAHGSIWLFAWFHAALMANSMLYLFVHVSQNFVPTVFLESQGTTYTRIARKRA